MSFTNDINDKNSPNYISCYYILKPKNEGSNTILGDISEPYSISGINIIDPNFVQSRTSIISNLSNNRNNFIVGIPKYNGNNVSSKKIYSQMALYNIDFLRSIIPYIKLAGNETTIPDDLKDCSGATFNKTNGNVVEMNKKEVKTIVDNLNLTKRLCLRDIGYFTR